jgi:hypothetical protein
MSLLSSGSKNKPNKEIAGTRGKLPSDCVDFLYIEQESKLLLTGCIQIITFSGYGLLDYDTV